MKHIQCPSTWKRNKPSIFLAGGITNCSQWQKTILTMLAEENLIILNPRRENFNVNDSNIQKEQIVWEYTHLNRADAILFWFPCETVCPITLFEYGKWITQNKRLFVGCHPSYQRKIDLQIQTKLVRPEQIIYDDLKYMAHAIKQWVRI